MLRRIEFDDSPIERAAIAASTARDAQPIAPPEPAVEFEGDLLPRDHPKWIRDGLSVSQRARNAIAGLRPVVLRVLHFWDHGMRAILVAGRRVRVDPSGSYRVVNCCTIVS